MGRNPYTSMVYKVDWFAFTVSDEIDTDGAEKGFVLLENLGYDLAEFRGQFRGDTSIILVFRLVGM